MWASQMAQRVEDALQGKPALLCFFVEFKGGRRELALPGCPVTSVIVPTHAFPIYTLFFLKLFLKSTCCTILNYLESAVV